MKKLGSEKDIHFESGLFKPKLWSRQIFKKGMAYFLCFVLLVGSMQGISCAEGNLEEIAERIESEEPQSVSHDSENEQGASSEEGISSVNEEEAGNQAENGENIAEDRPEEIGAEDGSEENSEAGESGLSEEEAQKKKAVYMDAGSFSELADHDLTVTAIFGDKTFFEGTTMKVEVLEEESIIQEAKAALEAQYRKEDAKKEAKAEEKEEKEKRITEERNERRQKAAEQKLQRDQDKQDRQDKREKVKITNAAPVSVSEPEVTAPAPVSEKRELTPEEIRRAKNALKEARASYLSGNKAAKPAKTPKNTDKVIIKSDSKGNVEAIRHTKEESEKAQRILKEIRDSYYKNNKK